MNEKLLKYVGWLPLAAILIYVFGYVALSSYLRSFGINENIGLDVKIIKLGILFTIITGPIVMLAFSTFKVGDYSNAVPDVSDELIITLHDALGYSVIYSIGLGGLFFKYSFDTATCIMMIIFIMALVINKLKTHSKYLKILKASFGIIPFFTLVLCLLFLPLTGKLWLYFLQLTILFACYILRIFNKEGITFQISHIGVIITTLLFCANSFGKDLIIKIPSQYGGEQRIPNTYYIDTTSLDKIKKTDIKFYLKKNNTIVINAVYETSEKYYFKTFKNEILCVPKSYFDIVEIKIPK